MQNRGSTQRPSKGQAPNPLCTLGPEDQRPQLTTPATPKGPLSRRSRFPELCKGEASVCVCESVNYECIAHVRVHVSALCVRVFGCVGG